MNLTKFSPIRLISDHFNTVWTFIFAGLNFRRLRIFLHFLRSYFLQTAVILLYCIHTLCTCIKKTYQQIAAPRKRRTAITRRFSLFCSAQSIYPTFRLFLLLPLQVTLHGQCRCPLLVKCSSSFRVNKV